MYYIVYGALYLLSLLPMPILYLLSDFFFVLIYHVFGYRRNVVESNLRIAFPEKSDREIKSISKKFYGNFVDNFIETLKYISASNEFLRKRFSGDAEVLNTLYEKGKRCQVHMGHNFNWELANLSISFFSPYVFLGVYMPVKNKVIDRLLRGLRSKNGTVLLPATNMKETMLQYRDQQYLLGLIADQVPGNVSKAYWLNFFNKPTPFVQGPERGARSGNVPVVFANIEKRKRGYYHINLELASEEPANLPVGELTRRYRDYLEVVIRRNPDMWLWSHRRWKREWKEEYRDRWIDSNEPNIANAPALKY